MKLYEFTPQIYKTGIHAVVVDIFPRYGDIAIATLSSPPQFDLIAKFLQEHLDVHYDNSSEVVDIIGDRSQRYEPESPIIARLIHFSNTTPQALIDIIRSQVGIFTNKERLSIKPTLKEEFKYARGPLYWENLTRYLLDG